MEDFEIAIGRIRRMNRKGSVVVKEVHSSDHRHEVAVVESFRGDHNNHLLHDHTYLEEDLHKVIGELRMKQGIQR